MKFLTAGESHGAGLTGIMEGLPAGFAIDENGIRKALRLRRGGFGRGPRMAVEDDEIIFTGGLAGGKTYGAPLSFFIRNRDSSGVGRGSSVPRPGHSDLAGCLKYDLSDASLPSECMGGRKTAAYVAMGEIAEQFLAAAGIAVAGVTSSIGGIKVPEPKGMSAAEMRATAAGSPLRTADSSADGEIMEAISRASENGDTLGGTILIAADGVPPGLGGFSQPDKRLDSRLAFAIMSVPGIKGIEIGAGFAGAAMTGTEYLGDGYPDGVKSSGGIEGGMSDGRRITASAAMKPIPTTRRGVPSISLATGERIRSPFVRSDVCAVPAAAACCEAMTALTLLDAFLDRFGADTAGDTIENMRRTQEKVEKRTSK